jgi:hypothetical protein
VACLFLFDRKAIKKSRILRPLVPVQLRTAASGRKWRTVLAALRRNRQRPYLPTW